MKTKLSLDSTVRLNNGVVIPRLGFGTYKLREGSECFNAVKWALEAGYRHVDTAAIYGNEEGVGKAIAQSGLPRREVFVTTKLWNEDHHLVEQACKESLKKLRLDFVDLYLIHWPVPKLRLKAWKELEKLYEEGSCRAIGVSNFTIRHLRELLENCEIVPAVNQVEFSPFLYQKELLDYCKNNKIQLEAYSPLVRGQKMNDPRLVAIAKKYGKTPAQVLIRWALQKNLVTIPKSSKKERILENASVFDFEISKKDEKTMDGWNENYRTTWDPTEIP